MAASKLPARRPGAPTKCTRELTTTIVRNVRKGTYDYIAAEAAGISHFTFINWMNRGREHADETQPSKEDQPFVQFFKAVTRAKSQARQDAEQEVRHLDPVAYLRYGPGKTRPALNDETPEREGWTEQRQIEHKGNQPTGAPIVFTFNIDKATGRDDDTLGINQRRVQLEGPRPSPFDAEPK